MDEAAGKMFYECRRSCDADEDCGPAATCHHVVATHGECLRICETDRDCGKQGLCGRLDPEARTKGCVRVTP
jgi:hypothetical protein